MFFRTVRLSASLFTIFFAVCVCQKCPRYGETKVADPNNECRFLYCCDGRGRGWGKCSEGQVFSEQRQCCVTPPKSNQKSAPVRSYSSSQSYSSTKSVPSQKSYQQSQTRQDSDDSLGWDNDSDFDYHW